MAHFSVHSACTTVCSAFVSQSLLRYLKANKSGALILLYRASVSLVLLRPLAHEHFIFYCYGCVLVEGFFLLSPHPPLPASQWFGLKCSLLVAMPLRCLAQLHGI